MTRNTKIIVGIFALAFFVMSVVPVCGQSDFGSSDVHQDDFSFYAVYDRLVDLNSFDFTHAAMSGDGSIAYVKFNVIGYEGSVSPLKIVSLSANRAEDIATMDIPTQDGFFTVISVEQCRGDCNGDGKITAADALCALQMAVGKRAEDLVMDMNGDGSVTSLDAREILKKSVKKEEESGYGDLKVTYISWEEVQEKYTVPYDETFKYDDDGDGANEATLYYKGENNLVMSSDDTDKDGKVDLIFHYDDEEYLMRAIRDTDGDGEFDQILHFNRAEEIIKVEKIRSDDTRNSILFIILGSILFFLVMCFWLYVTKKQSCNSKMNELNYMGRINHQLGRRLILISISFLIIFALLVPPVSSLEDVIDDDCNIIQDVFDRDWKKYSHFDERIPLNEKNWETKQYYATQSEIVDAEVQIFFLRRDMEVDRQIRIKLNKYKQELVDRHRGNLLKSFMRLSFLTAHTTYEAVMTGISLAGKPTSPGGAYGNLFTTTSSVSAAGSVLKITDTYISMAPPDSTALAKNTQSITKSVDAVSKNVALEALESLGDPTKVGTELVKQVIDAVPIPHNAEEWKLTDEDFEILREAHLKNKEIDKVWAASFEVNLKRIDKVREFEAQIKELENELAEWETKEKNRVKATLEDSCKNEKKEKCDAEHLYLCDSEKECGDAGGYWYNNRCNKEEKEKEECDDEHLNLCDSEKECGDAGGYWYNNQCNVNPEEDTSDGEFNCPIPIPNEASHIVKDYSEYWSTANGYVGPYYSWYDSEKTKKHRFCCYNEGERHGVYKMWWPEDGTPKYECNYKDGKKHGVSKWWNEDGALMTELNLKDGKLHGVCKQWSANGELIYECNYEEDKCVSCVHGHC